MNRRELLMFSAGAFAAATLSGRSAQAEDVINIPFTRCSAFYSPLIATAADGFLEAEGLKPIFSVAEPGKSALAALANGSAHVVQSAPSQAFADLEKGPPCGGSFCPDQREVSPARGPRMDTEQRQHHVGGPEVIRYLAVLLVSLPGVCLAASPPCASWPTNMALVHLKNADIADPTKIDESKTKAVRLASEKVGKDRYRQVYDITFYEKTGSKVEVITSSEASNEECSMSGVDVFVVSRRLGGP